MNYWVVKGKPYPRNNWDEMLQPQETGEWEEDPRSAVKYQLGDRIFFWESSPKLRIIALGEFSSTGIRFRPNGKREFEVRYLTGRLQVMPGIAELRGLPILRNSQFLLKTIVKTVYPLNDAEATTLLQLLHDRNPDVLLLTKWRKDVAGASAISSGPPEFEDVSVGESSMPATRQGFASSPEVRKAVENHAVEMARRHFKRLGYEVELYGKPFDLRCRSDDETLYIEVKGTQGEGSEILLTKGEVKFHRENMGRTALFVVSEIRVSETLIASGGKALVLNPWIMDENSLFPYAFSYRL